MLKIHCPECKKSFLWTDDMPTKGKCLNTDCEANYDIHSALKQNIDRLAVVAEKKILLCPSCGEEISSHFTICRNCRHVVLDTMFIKESHLFMGVCILLIVLSLILKYLVN